MSFDPAPLRWEFPTISDFTSLLIESEKHIFKNHWATEFPDKLITAIAPKTIIVFGRTNLNYLKNFLGVPDIGVAYNFKASTENGLTSSANYWIFPYKQFKIIGLSVNLGNPKGFSKKTLNEFGIAIGKKINPTGVP